jgi:hypothetical protein
MYNLIEKYVISRCCLVLVKSTLMSLECSQLSSVQVKISSYSQRSWSIGLMLLMLYGLYQWFCGSLTSLSIGKQYFRSKGDQHTQIVSKISALAISSGSACHQHRRLIDILPANKCTRQEFSYRNQAHKSCANQWSSNIPDEIVEVCYRYKKISLVNIATCYMDQWNLKDWLPFQLHFWCTNSSSLAEQFKLPSENQ